MKFSLLAVLLLTFLCCYYHGEAIHNSNGNGRKQTHNQPYTKPLHHASSSSISTLKIDQPFRLLQSSETIFNISNGGGRGQSIKNNNNRGGLKSIIQKEHGGTTDKNINEVGDDVENNVCSYVCHILNKRYSQVMNEERSYYFANHYKKRIDTIDGQCDIVSGHGREQHQPHELIRIEEPYVHMINHDDDDKKSSSCFPPDLLSLDMVFTQQMYNTARKEIQQKYLIESSENHDMYEREKLFVPRLLARAVHLGFNFTPVTLTVGLAVMSKTFRENVWYNLVGKCLAKSGPAFIKWGECIHMILTICHLKLISSTHH